MKPKNQSERIKEIRKKNPSIILVHKEDPEGWNDEWYAEDIQGPNILFIGTKAFVTAAAKRTLKSDYSYKYILIINKKGSDATIIRDEQKCNECGAVKSIKFKRTDV